MNDKGGWS